MNVDFGKIIVCESCGCIFDIDYAMKHRLSDKDLWITICPLCKSEYELPYRK
jgi:hypothetical protein